MTVLSLAKPRFDFGARREPVTTHFAPLHHVRLPGVSSAWMHRYGDHAIVQVLAPRKAIVELAADGTTSELPFPVISFQRSALGRPMLTSSDHVVYDWDPGQSPRAMYTATEAGEHFAFALGDDAILVNRFEGQDDRGWYAQSLTVPAERLWTLSPPRMLEVVAPQGILWTRCDENGDNVELDCHDPANGALRWTCPWAIGSTIAIVGDVLWGGWHGALRRVDLRTGIRLPDVAVRQTAAPNGLVDEHGVFHCSNGFNYQKFDLRDDGRLLDFTTFEVTVNGPKRCSGSLDMALADDGRMVFGDEGGGVWVVHPDRPTKPELVWRAPGPIFTVVVQHGKLWLNVYQHGYVLLG